MGGATRRPHDHQTMIALLTAAAQFSLLFSCLCFAQAGLITAQKGDVRVAVSLTILHVYTHRLYSILYGLPQTVIEHHVINC
jgi:hypothetical protein